MQSSVLESDLWRCDEAGTFRPRARLNNHPQKRRLMDQTDNNLNQVLTSAPFEDSSPLVTKGSARTAEAELLFRGPVIAAYPILRMAVFSGAFIAISAFSYMSRHGKLHSHAPVDVPALVNQSGIFLSVTILVGISAFTHSIQVSQWTSRLRHTTSRMASR